MTKSETCPDAARMKDHACANRHQCWEPCGELGKSPDHARPVELNKAFPAGGPLLGEDGPLLVG